jgi:hypothetical protein
MLWQLQQVLNDGTREFIAQTENPNRWESLAALQHEHPLPEGAIWEMVREDNPHFFVMVEDDAPD